MTLTYRRVKGSQLTSAEADANVDHLLLSSNLSFTQSGTGTVSTDLQEKERRRVDLFDWLTAAQRADVTAGTGSIDVSTAVQAAFDDGRPLYANPGKYKISSLRSIPAKLDLKGDWHFGKTGSTAHAVFAIDAGVAGFQTPSTGSGAEALGISIEGIVFSGGTTQLNVRNGGVGLRVHNSKFDSPSVKGLAAAGFCQDWDFNQVEFNGGQYGLYMDSAAGSSGSSSLFDKSLMRRVYAHGQTINGIWNKHALSNNVRWEQPSLINITQDGWVIDGGIRDWLIDNTNTESNGYLGSAPVAATTGTTTAASANVTVASGTNLNNGDVLTIAGAGTSGADWYPTISSGGGTVNLVMTTTAPTSVTSGEVVKYLYSDIKITNAVATPGQILFNGGSYGIGSSVGAVRYGIDCAGLQSGVMIAPRNTRPIYDPGGVVSFISPIDGVIRRPQNYLTETFTSVVISNSAYRNQIPSSNGGNFTVGMRDSAGNASGTYGAFEVRRYDSNRTRTLYHDPSIGGPTWLHGPLSPGGFGAGTGAAATIAPVNLNIVFGNAAPTLGTWQRGDRVMNQTPTVGQPKGWICTVAGTPGTWVSEGNL